MTIFSNYKSIIEYSPDCVCRFNTKFELTFVNKAFAELVSFPAEKLYGLSLKNIIRPAEQAEFFRAFEKLTPEHSRASVKSPRFQKDGGAIIISWTIVGIFNEDGLLQDYQASGRDVTELTRLNTELQKRNEELEAYRHEMRIVMDAMPCKIWYKDDKNTILRINQTAAESMGSTIDAIEGQNTYDLYGDIAKKYHDDDLKVIKTGEPLLGHVERYDPNEGQPGWLRTDKIPFDDPLTGEKRILVVSMDITELKEQQALLETINKNLDDFASLTSHDLQAPLRHIGIFAELLESQYKDALPEEGQSYVREIHQSAENMQSLIKNFLKFMRSAPGSVEFESIDLKALIDEVSTNFEPEIMSFKGKIKTPKTEMSVRGEPGLLRQVMTNLIENAIKYRDLSKPPKIEISAQQSAGQWFITVADNGVGLPAGDTSHIFNLFSRTKPHSTREGSGIGLALCKRLVTLHGGQISAKRNAGGGSDFTFNLNVTKEPLDA